MKGRFFSTSFWVTLKKMGKIAPLKAWCFFIIFFRLDLWPENIFVATSCLFGYVTTKQNNPSISLLWYPCLKNNGVLWANAHHPIIRRWVPLGTSFDSFPWIPPWRNCFCVAVVEIMLGLSLIPDSFDPESNSWAISFSLVCSKEQQLSGLSSDFHINIHSRNLSWRCWGLNLAGIHTPSYCPFLIIEA